MSRGKGKRAASELVLIAGAIATLGGTTAMAVHRLKEDPSGEQVTTAASTPPASTTTAPAAGTAPSAPTVAGPVTQERESAALARIAATGLPVYCGGGRGNLVGLTFDGGPGPRTAEILDRLRRNRSRATFFLVSSAIAESGDLVPRMLRRGTLGDHTVTRRHLRALGPAAQEHEIADAQHAIEKRSGRPVEVFRPPYGERSPRIDALARRHDLAQILWSANAADVAGASAAQTKRQLIATLRPGAILRLDETRPEAIRALPAILHAIRARRLRAVSLPLLLTLDPPSPAQLRGGSRTCRAGAAAAAP